MPSFDPFHVFPTADQRSTTYFGYGNFVAANIAPVLLTNLFDCHIASSFPVMYFGNRDTVRGTQPDDEKS